MKTRIFSAVLVLMIVGCKSPSGTTGTTSATVPDGSAGQIPVAMACPASLDPNQGCPSPTAQVNPLRTGTQSSAVRPKRAAAKKLEQTIVGRCEMIVEGDKDVRPCTELTLMLKSQSGDQRRGLVDGFNVKFIDLKDGTYALTASAENYDVTTDTRELTPGQTVKIRVQAKAR